MKARMIIGGGLLMGALVLGVLPAIAQEDTCYGKDGNWSADTQKCTVSLGVHVDVDYPLALVQYPDVAKVIDAFIADQQQSFISSYVPDYTLPAHVNDWSMLITNELYPFSDTIQTVVFNISSYTGGAHPNSGYRSFTFNVQTGTPVLLKDVFAGGNIPWDTLSQLVQADLKTKLGDMMDATMIEQGTGTNPDNYQNWALTPESLIFFFDPYQVAPYAAGPQQVAIPFTALKGLLTAPFGS